MKKPIHYKYFSEAIWQAKSLQGALKTCEDFSSVNSGDATAKIAREAVSFFRQGKQDEFNALAELINQSGRFNLEEIKEITKDLAKIETYVNQERVTDTDGKSSDWSFSVTAAPKNSNDSQYILLGKRGIGNPEEPRAYSYPELYHQIITVPSPSLLDSEISFDSILKDENPSFYLPAGKILESEENAANFQFFLRLRSAFRNAAEAKFQNLQLEQKQQYEKTLPGRLSKISHDIKTLPVFKNNRNSGIN